jgi:hypothetical protein
MGDLPANHQVTLVPVHDDGTYPGTRPNDGK